MGQSSQHGDLVAPGLEGLKRLVEGEVLPSALGKPVPMTSLAILAGKADPLGEIDRAEPSGSGTCRRGSQGFHPRQSERNARRLKHGSSIHLEFVWSHDLRKQWKITCINATKKLRSE